MRYAISIVNWNSSKLIMQCVQQLDDIISSQCKIFIVDNGSREDDYAKLHAWASDRHNIELIRQEENLGFAAGHLQTVQRADDMDAVWLLNPDVVFDAQTFSELVRVHEQYPDAVLGSVTLEGHPDDGLPTSQRKVNFHYKFFQHPYREILFSRHPYRLYQDVFEADTPHTVSAIAGSSLFIPMSVIREHGFMRTDFFLYTEEIDYCFRLGRHGVPMVVVPTSRIYHQKQGSSSHSSQLSSVTRYYRIRNQLIRIGLYGSAYDQWRATLKNIALLLHTLMVKRDFFGARLIWYAMHDGTHARTGIRFAPDDYMA
jgi:GT2 family glycosyltransferase